MRSSLFSIVIYVTIGIGIGVILQKSQRSVTVVYQQNAVQQPKKAVCTAEEFASNTVVLNRKFKWAAKYPNYVRPLEPIEQQKIILVQAFKKAPKSMQNGLCNLNAHFLDNTIWSLRETPKLFAKEDQPNNFNRYIALASDIPPSFATYESNKVHALLPNIAGISVVANGNSVMTMLAGMAHEYGHLLFMEKLRGQPGSKVNENNFCNGKFFISWEHPINFLRYHSTFNGYDGRHAGSEQINELYNSTDLQHMLRSQQWASVMASFYPEHDFVETYTLAVLLFAGLTEYEIEFTDKMSVNLMAYTRGETPLARKLRCFTNLVR